MGGGSVLSLRVTGDESRGLLTVLEGVVSQGGPPLHVHDEEDEAVIVLEGRLTYRVGNQTGVLPAGGLLWFSALHPARRRQSLRGSMPVPHDRHAGRN